MSTVNPVVTILGVVQLTYLRMATIACRIWLMYCLRTWMFLDVLSKLFWIHVLEQILSPVSNFRELVPYRRTNWMRLGNVISRWVGKTTLSSFLEDKKHAADKNIDAGKPFISLPDDLNLKNLQFMCSYKKWTLLDSKNICLLEDIINRYLLAGKKCIVG